MNTKCLQSVLKQATKTEITLTNKTSPIFSEINKVTEHKKISLESIPETKLFVEMEKQKRNTYPLLVDMFSKKGNKPSSRNNMG